jgi:hypothetical protein
MVRSLLALLVVAAFAFPASAQARGCETPSVYTHIETYKVGCAQAKKIFKAFFKDGTELFGYQCVQRQYEGGATTTCKKGEHKAIYYVAD